jgi:large repetitive protein
MRNRILTLLITLFALPSFAAITGVVMTTDGKPVAGAKITITSFDPIEHRRVRLLTGAPAPAPIATTQTGTNGAFTLETPKDPLVDLRIEASGYEPQLRRVERDEETGAIALRKADMKSGTVSANGKGVANAKVMIAYGGADFTATTDAEGRYSAPDPKGALRIVVIHPDYAILEEMSTGSQPLKLDRTLVAGSKFSGKVVGQDNRTPVAKAEILVDGWPLATTADDGSFTIQHLGPKWQTMIARTPSLMGIRSRASETATTIRVNRPATISGTVRDSKTQTPIANVAVRTGGLRFDSSESQVVLTDAKGNFSFPSAPGSFRLSANHPGYELGAAQVSAAAGQTVSKPILIAQLARISGTVTDEDKQPIAAAVVASEEARSNDDMMPPMRMMMRGGEGIGRSGPDGRFTIRVAESEVRVTAAKKGLPQGKSENLKVVAGERKRGVTVMIPRGFELAGKVTDKDGKPISGVTVTAGETQSGPAGMFQFRTVIGGPRQNDDEFVKTGSDGTFAMRLKEGTYDVAFRREGYASKSVRAHQVTSASKAVETTLDPSVDITGRVVRNGAGVEGVNVFSFSMGGPSSQAVTGPDGSFVLTDLSPGPARVNFNKPDDFISEVRNLTAPGRDVVVDVPPGGRVIGRVVDKSTKQPVPVFSAGVSPSRGGGGMMMVGPAQMRSFTSDDGSFVLENVAAGAVNLMVSAPGFTTTRMSNIAVEEGKTVSDVVVEMDTGTKLTGRVTGPSGQPLAGVAVRQTMNANMRAVPMGNMEYTATTDANGDYTMDAVEPGEKTFQFQHSDFLTSTKTVDITGRDARLDAQLTTGTRVTGIVVTEGGAPMPDAQVRAMSAGGSASSTRSGAGGAFTIERLAPGRYTFTASKTGLADGTLRDFDINSGGPVRITLKSGGTIYGRVSGVADADLSSTMVEARGADGTATGPVDAQGNFRIEGAPTGTVRVAAMVMRGFPDRRTTEPKTIELQPGDSRQVDVEFRTDVAVTGRVTRNGQMLSGASVQFSPRRGTARTSAGVSTDERGVYTVTGLSDGEYNVNVVDLQRFTPFNTTYTVTGSGTFDIDIRTVTLRGRVLDSSTGEGIGDARVQLRASSSEMGMMFPQRSALTDSAGNFTIDSVAPGRYSATADKDGYGNQVVDTNVTDSAAGELDFKLARNDGITLKIVDGRDGRQLSGGAYVTDMQGRVVHDEGGFRMGGGGASDMRLPLAAGSYKATIWAYGYAAQTVTLTSPGRQTIGLTPGGTLVIRSKESSPRRARLVDASGAVYMRGGYRLPTFTIDAGTTTMQSIAPGNYTLQLLDNNDRILDSVPVQVLEGQTASYDA